MVTSWFESCTREAALQLLEPWQNSEMKADKHMNSWHVTALLSWTNLPLPPLHT